MVITITERSAGAPGFSNLAITVVRRGRTYQGYALEVVIRGHRRMLCPELRRVGSFRQAPMRIRMEVARQMTEEVNR